MEWLRKKITDLRNKPYAVRVRILKIGVIIIGLILILLWFLTLSYRETPESSKPFENFTSIFKNLQKLKDLKVNQ